MFYILHKRDISPIFISILFNFHWTLLPQKAGSEVEEGFWGGGMRDSFLGGGVLVVLAILLISWILYFLGGEGGMDRDMIF